MMATDLDLSNGSRQKAIQQESLVSSIRRITEIMKKRIDFKSGGN